MSIFLRGINSANNQQILQKAPDAALMVPMMVGGMISVKSKILPNTDILAKNGWYWLRLDRAFGSIGKASSSAQIKSDVLEYLFLEWGGSQGDWDAGVALSIPDYRGRVMAIAGQGTGLSPRAIGEVTGEEEHILVESESFPHNHGGGNHLHYTNLNRQGSNQNTGSWAGRGGNNTGPSYVNYYSNSSGNIIGWEGGGQPHNNIQPTIYEPSLCFLGVQV